MFAQISTYIVHFIQSSGYIGIFVLMTFESALLPLPSEVIMPFAGFLVSQGFLSFLLVVLVGAVGNVAGSLIGYYIGFLLERSVLLTVIRRYGKFILFTEEDYATSLRWFERYGSGVVFISRLLPGIRTYISLPAGVCKMNVWKFSLYTFMGSLLWSALLTYIGVYVGSRWNTLGPVFSSLQYVIAVILLILIFLFIYRKLFKK